VQRADTGLGADAPQPDMLIRGAVMLDPKSPLTREVPIDATSGIDEA
jgi:hypothetical protein